MVSGLSGLLALIASDSSFNASLGSTSGGVGVVSGLSGLLALIASDTSFNASLGSTSGGVGVVSDSLDY